MARLQPLADNRQPVLARIARWFTRRRYGQEVASLGFLAHSPSMLMPALMMTQMANAKTKLPTETRSLVMHLVAARNGCAWCIDFGLAKSLKEGVSLEKLTAVPDYATDSRFSAAEKAALAYAEAVTAGDGRVADEIFAALRPHFDEREIVELTLLTALENFFNRVNGPLGIESQNFCVMPTTPRQPAPAALSVGR